MACETRRFSSALLIGIAIVFWGVAILVDQLGIFHFHMSNWWPLILVVFGTANLFEDNRGGRHIWGVGLLLAGLLLFANENGLVRVRWEMIWPLIIIAVGVGMVWQAVGGGTDFR